MTTSNTARGFGAGCDAGASDASCLTQPVSFLSETAPDRCFDFI